MGSASLSINLWIRHTVFIADGGSPTKLSKVQLVLPQNMEYLITTTKKVSEAPIKP